MSREDLRREKALVEALRDLAPRPDSLIQAVELEIPGLTGMIRLTDDSGAQLAERLRAIRKALR